MIKMGYEMRWSDGVPWLRKSCLEDWSWCPWKFKHVWLDENYALPNRQMAVGTRFHEFADQFFEVCGTVDPEEWELLVPVDDLQPDEVEMWMWFVQEERRRLYKLVDAGRGDEFQPIFREFKMENKERFLESTCDRADWECRELGMVALVEYKTGEKVNDRSLERQLAFYSLLWKETLGIGEVNVLRLINPRLQIVKEYELTRRALTEVEGMIRDMRLAIQSGEFPKKCSERKYPYCRVCTPQESGAFRCQEFDICDVDDVTFEEVDEEWD